MTVRPTQMTATPIITMKYGALRNRIGFGNRPATNHPTVNHKPNTTMRTCSHGLKSCQRIEPGV